MEVVFGSIQNCFQPETSWIQSSDISKLTMAQRFDHQIIKFLKIWCFIPQSICNVMLIKFAKGPWLENEHILCYFEKNVSKNVFSVLKKWLKRKASGDYFKCNYFNANASCKWGSKRTVFWGIEGAEKFRY